MDEQNIINTVKGKKRSSNPAEWKCNKRKEARVKGSQYVNYKGVIVKEVEVGELCRYVVS